MITRKLLVAALACMPLCAQNNPFTLVPQTEGKIPFRSSTNTPNTLLTRVDADAIRGACQSESGSGAVGRMTGFNVEIEDGNGATAPLLTFVVRQAATTADIFSISFRLPPAEAETVRYSVTAALGTPFDGIPKAQNFHFGLQVPFSASPNDQVRVMAAPHSTAPAKPSAPHVCFSIEPFVGLIPVDVTLAMHLTTQGPTMMAAGIVDASGTLLRGRSGLYPDRQAGMGLGFTINAGRSKAYRPFWVLGGAPFGFAAPLAIPRFEGELFLTLPFLPTIPAAGVLNAAGRASVASPLAPYGTFSYYGQLYFQTLIGGSELLLTNAVRSDDS